MTDLTPVQEVMLIQYHLARIAWQNANSVDLRHAGTVYAAALDACLDAGFDPFHYPVPQ
jgi:hypothetical protein